MQSRTTEHAATFPAGYFVGDTASWKISGAILSEVRHPVGKSVPLHEHQAPYFSLLLDGAYTERGDGFDLWYEPYTLVFHDARTSHEDEMIGPCRFFAVALLQRWEEVIAQLGGARAHVFELDGGDPVWIVLRLYQEFLARAHATESAVEALLYELCAHVAPAQPGDLHEPPWLPSIDTAIHERFREPLDLAEVAAGSGVHPVHLCRTFRRFRGRTISDALLGIRVAHVCRRLIESDETLASIAHEAGFADQSHMSRVFKRLTGYAPGAHRRRERQAKNAR